MNLSALTTATGGQQVHDHRNLGTRQSQMAVAPPPKTIEKETVTAGTP